MTSLIRYTRRSPFQQVCQYHPMHNGTNILNCILNYFFLELRKTSRSTLIDNILDITRKFRRNQIWAMWQPLANSLTKKFCQKRTLCFSQRVVMHYLVEKLHRIHPYAKMQ